VILNTPGPISSLERTMSNRIAPKLLAEFIGTFSFVFIGAGAAAVVGDAVGLPSIAAIAFAHGLTIMVFAFAYGSISGGHMNPAVTAGVLAAGAMSVGEAIGYIVSQLMGGIAGSSCRPFWGAPRRVSAHPPSRTTSLSAPRRSRSRPLPAS
jgi:glycerol uptake facilitator-like aquaporin